MICLKSLFLLVKYFFAKALSFENKNNDIFFSNESAALESMVSLQIYLASFITFLIKLFCLWWIAQMRLKTLEHRLQKLSVTVFWDLWACDIITDFLIESRPYYAADRFFVLMKF